MSVKMSWGLLAAIDGDSEVSWVKSYLKVAKQIVLKSGLMVLKMEWFELLLMEVL